MLCNEKGSIIAFFYENLFSCLDILSLSRLSILHSRLVRFNKQSYLGRALSRPTTIPIFYHFEFFVAQLFRSQDRYKTFLKALLCWSNRFSYKKFRSANLPLQKYAIPHMHRFVLSNIIIELYKAYLYITDHIQHFKLMIDFMIGIFLIGKRNYHCILYMLNISRFNIP